MGIKSKINQLKREMLLQEASYFFEEVGYEEMKLSELAKKAGVSMGTIYGYFNSKEGLYAAYIAYQIDQFMQEFSRETEHLSSAEEKLKVYAGLKFSYYMRKSNALSYSIRHNPFYFPGFYKVNAHPLGKIFTALSLSFREIDPALSENEAVEMAYLFNGLTDGYVGRWYEEQYDLMGKTDEACRRFLAMMDKEREDV
jgi:AcrR family transcriptional regulator